MSEEKKETGLSVVTETNLPAISQEERDAIRLQVQEGMNKIPMGDIVKNAFSATMKAFAAGKVNIQDIVEEAMVSTVIDQKVKQMALQQSEPTTEEKPISLNQNNNTDAGE